MARSPDSPCSLRSSRSASPASPAPAITGSYLAAVLRHPQARPALLPAQVGPSQCEAAGSAGPVARSDRWCPRVSSSPRLLLAKGAADPAFAASSAPVFKAGSQVQASDLQPTRSSAQVASQVFKVCAEQVSKGIQDGDEDGWQTVSRRRKKSGFNGAFTAGGSPSDFALLLKKESRGKCFRCLSPSHFVAFCSAPPRCLLCKESGHRARSCRLRRGRGVPVAIPQVGANSHMEPGPFPGSPAGRPCFASRYAAQVATSSDLEDIYKDQALVAYVLGDADAQVTTKLLQSSFEEFFRVSNKRLCVQRHSPNSFFVMTDSLELRDYVIRRSNVSIAGLSFRLRPWSRFLVAGAKSARFKVRLCIEGVPRHAWSESAIAPLISPSGYLVSELDSTRLEREEACVCAWVWTDDANSFPKEAPFFLEEPRVAGVGALSPPRMLVYRVIIHVDTVVDFQCPSREHRDDESPVTTYSFDWILGVVDGPPGQQAPVHARLGQGPGDDDDDMTLPPPPPPAPRAGGRRTTQWDVRPAPAPGAQGASSSTSRRQPRNQGGGRRRQAAAGPRPAVLCAKSSSRDVGVSASCADVDNGQAPLPAQPQQLLVSSSPPSPASREVQSPIHRSNQSTTLVSREVRTSEPFSASGKEDQFVDAASPLQNLFSELVRALPAPLLQPPKADQAVSPRRSSRLARKSKARSQLRPRRDRCLQPSWGSWVLTKPGMAAPKSVTRPSSRATWTPTRWGRSGTWLAWQVGWTSLLNSTRPPGLSRRPDRVFQVVPGCYSLSPMLNPGYMPLVRCCHVIRDVSLVVCSTVLFHCTFVIGCSWELPIRSACKVMTCLCINSTNGVGVLVGYG